MTFLWQDTWSRHEHYNRSRNVSGGLESWKKYTSMWSPLSRVSMCGQTKWSLISMPINETPFKGVAMDVVGPLPWTAKGNQYILVLCDYATRYPMAYSLCTFMAPAVAEKLMHFMSEHGLPQEMLTDQGTNFTWTLLQELYQMLEIKGIRTMPYHPLMEGLVEHDN